MYHKHHLTEGIKPHLPSQLDGPAHFTKNCFAFTLPWRRSSNKKKKSRRERWRRQSRPCAEGLRLVLVYDLIKTPPGGGPLPAPPDDTRMRAALRDAAAGWGAV